MNLNTGFVVIKYLVDQQRAVVTNPGTVSYQRSKDEVARLRKNGELALSIHESFVSVMDLFDENDFIKKETK
jgi:hypothetical protein